MSGEWIKMRMDLYEDPSVFRLAGIVKLDRFSVVGRLHAFWSWIDKHAVDGRVDGAPSLIVDEICSCVGFAEALVSVKWLVVGDGFLEIPKHDRHNGHSAKERALKNNRQAKWRAGNVPFSVDGESSTLPSTTASTRRREEEEKNIKTEPEQKSTRAKRASLTPLPSDFSISDRVQDWADRNDYARLGEHLEHFVTVSKARAYVYADWDAAFMTAIRKDWAGIRAPGQSQTLRTQMGKTANAISKLQGMKNGNERFDLESDAAPVVPRVGGTARR